MHTADSRQNLVTQNEHDFKVAMGAILNFLMCEKHCLSFFATSLPYLLETLPFPSFKENKQIYCLEIYTATANYSIASGGEGIIG